ncbi:hypothetical protein NESM_000417700 [Novymonas esmeraldas]|uniref:LSM domain-containing protein n=1 Tax=Novymonas esmeraldas TaxID=1808958 RepID=A0AAW0ENT3_9TRYP
MSEGVITLPGVLARGPALHALVRVELTNSAIVVGRLLEMDAATMNLKIDAITLAAVRRRRHHHHHTSSGAATAAAPAAVVGGSVDDAAEDAVEVNPIALRCVQSIVIRGACVRYLDFLHEAKDGGASYGEVLAAAEQVRPSI